MSNYKIGEGSYGNIYLFDNYVLKINIIENEINGISGNSIKELDMLNKLKGHPYIIDLISISFGILPSNTNFTIIDDKSSGVKHDNLYFIFDYIPITLKKFLNYKHINFEIRKYICCQLLLAIEFMHYKNITHRDLKPDNILINEINGEYQLKIIDFGMSQILNESTPSTPGVSTSWYRAPEICCKHTKYSKKSDLWSIGCIIFEIFSLKPLLYGNKDNDNILFNKILSLIPKISDDIFLENYIKLNKTIKINKKNIIEYKSFIDLMNLNDKVVKIENENFQLLENLLQKLLTIDYIKRYDATTCLSDLFFKNNYEFIAKFKIEYPLNDLYMPIIKIIDCIEHKWIIDLSYILYNKSSKIKWVTPRILFHAIDLFDRYLEYLSNINELNQEFIETDNQGKFLNINDTIFNFYVCLYLFYKYYNTLEISISFINFFLSNFNYDINNLIKFEVFLINNVCKNEIYRETLLEMMIQHSNIPTNENIKILLFKYGSIIEWNNGSVRSLYKHLYN